MTDKIMQTIDLAGASYSIALLGMVATSVLLLMGSAWVSNKYKLSVTLCGLTAVIGVFTLFESRVVWLFRITSTTCLSLCGVDRIFAIANHSTIFLCKIGWFCFNRAFLAVINCIYSDGIIPLSW